MQPQFPELDAWMRWASFTLALAGLFRWLGDSAGSDRDDADTEECHTAVMDALSDADGVRTLAAITDRNLRDQLTVGDAQALHDELELSRLRGRRN